MSSSLSSLPQELLTEIMIRLDSHSILQMALTSRSFYAIFQSTPIRYIYELGMNSLQDAGSSKSTDELLVLLRDWQKAWATLEWKSLTTVELPPNQQSFKQSAGILVELDETDLLVVYLPSSTQPSRTIRHSIDGMHIYDVAIDGNQDLVILAGHFELPDKRCIRLYCRTISMNEVHPNATPGGILEFDIHEDKHRERNLRTMQVTLADDVVAFCGYWREGRPRLLLWNWTAGLVLFNSFEDLLPDCPPNLSFDFLRRDAFLLTSAASSGQIVVYRFSPTAPGTPVHVASFGLPPIVPPISVLSSTFLRYMDDSASNPSEARDVPWEMWGERESRFTEMDHDVSSRSIHGSHVVHGLHDGTSVEVLDFSSGLPCLTSTTCKRHGSDSPTVVPRKQIFLQDVVTRLPYRVVSKVIEAKPPINWKIDEQRIIALGVGLLVHSFAAPTY
ncbi:hypothetical protein NLJ89_g10423 [Agrocybe chaxingu]|uniref:F-box domain-containing protein n=1 Tax=Agrocybe chaxingu TaxID=84603 RepID=A0A9W8JY72_9AGAR|nr:hypothetical protein NLJ89_g10423 [Agrocybe chaxingu]